ncbi:MULTISPECIES: glutaminase A [Mycolicibacterium]|uniref:Glutaminase n=2 Tax=Mycolicibacterium gilvum TaxID=1804 RepID=A0A378SU12_9MYCO|nr:MULTISPECIES: glutaminase A [Mycolicibacterium]ABP44809.1 Glutaminase [Mycolicibacterium gilvum PYR-GCK]MBV5244809.1 glutaminase A [Mycolicibacterium sp. PAM1]MCV7056800.1 glutaminase A [Mycolicibacterium gilvum]STZ44877.1 glutaminase [Mycolicibacterium gilvum]
MAELVQRRLDRIRAEHAEVADGELADYIPELAGVDPDGFGLSLSTSDGFIYESGQAATEFTIQSISKPLTYALALHLIGLDAVDARIGVEPSGEAFNEISVDRVTNNPKNPMINAGAITAVSLIPAGSPDERFALIHDFYSACVGRRLELDHDVYTSEKASGARNRAIGYMLQSFGALDDDPDEVLDVYYRQCSLRVTCTDLARMGATLARGGMNPVTGRRVTSAAVVRRTLSVMVTCGMYDGAGDWVSAVGMPAKSGVGGGIVAVLPGQLGIGVYSPRLDDKGNSVRGVLTCRSLSEQLGLHFLTVRRDARATLRAVYEPRPGVRVYEAHGDLLFSGAEEVLRVAERERDRYDVTILDVSRVDDIDDTAREMLSALGAALRADGKEGHLVDPDGVVARAGSPEIRFRTVDDVLDALDRRRRPTP